MAFYDWLKILPPTHVCACLVFLRAFVCSFSYIYLVMPSLGVFCLDPYFYLQIYACMLRSRFLHAYHALRAFVSLLGMCALQPTYAGQIPCTRDLTYVCMLITGVHRGCSKTLT